MVNKIGCIFIAKFLGIPIQMNIHQIPLDKWITYRIRKVYITQKCSKIKLISKKEFALLKK